MAFEEALHIARERYADFVLLGGDLFHTNRPSASIEHKCIKIIRQHMNAKVDHGTNFRRVSGEFSHFQKLRHPNFEDPNLKVPCPIMTIHGNHDDPTGPDAQSVCEKLATCGLLNYFGIVSSQTQKINIDPIILEKDNIKIALYGIGFIPDQKLRAAFDRGDVMFTAPPKDTFNILVVHQNRVPYSALKHIPDELFPKFFHLLVRGHEHDTQSPERIPDSKVDGIVYQPGSTVATSISSRESGKKRVGLMSIQINDLEGDRKSRYKLDYQLIDLQCCRPMLFKDITRKEILKYIKTVDDRKKLTPIEYRQLTKNYVEQCIKSLVKENNEKLASQRESQASSSFSRKLDRFKMPLLRVRLEYISKSERFDEFDISSLFYPNEVANRDIVLFKKQKINEGKDGETENVTFRDEDEDLEEEDEFDYINLVEERQDTIDVMIENYFHDKPPSKHLQALSLKEYTNAVRGSNEDGNVISKVLSKKKQEVLMRYNKALTDEKIAEENFHNEILVEKWLLSAFNEGNHHKPAGDDMDVIICD